MKNGVPVAVSSMERGLAEQRGMWGRDNFFLHSGRKGCPTEQKTSWNSSYFLACLAPQCEFGLASFLPHGWLLPCPSGSPQHPELPVLMGTRSAPANPGDSIRCQKHPFPLMLFGLQQDVPMSTEMGRCNSSHHLCVTDQKVPSLHRANPA